MCKDYKSGNVIWKIKQITKTHPISRCIYNVGQNVVEKYMYTDN